MAASNRDRLADAGLAVVVLCVLLLTSFAVYDRVVTSVITDPIGSVGAGTSARALSSEEWMEATSAGHVRGSAAAPVTMVVFSDFECPACRSLARSILPRLDSLFPGAVKVLYRHWPLGSHEFAFEAARASECAALQGKYESMHNALFESQRAIGAVDFVTFAEKAGVPNIDAFQKCTSEASVDEAIERDVALITKLGGKGTPAVAINGTFFPAGVNREVLDSIVGSAR